MEGITLGEVAGWISLIAGMITGISVITKFAIKKMRQVLHSELEPLNQKMDDLANDIKRVELEACKNFLTRFLTDVEQGHKIDEIELQRYHEVYARYTSPELNGNSYFHSKVDKLKGQGKL